ncbi:MAG: hypothetical protein K1X94_23495 [Sandaracinaceae bacterium]|nr:hypothetical protein [Sandaracinaceae bacterium]
MHSAMRPAIAVIAVVFLAALAGLAWLYTRSVIDEAEIGALRERASLVWAARPTEGTDAPRIECEPYADARERLADPRHGMSAEARADARAQLEPLWRTCRESLHAAWQHERVGANSADEVSDATRWLVADATEIGDPAQAMNVTAEGLWAVDGIVRSGRLDVSESGLLGLLAVSVTNLHQLRPLTEEEASRVRALLARVREHHPRRLDRPELLIANDRELAAQVGPLDADATIRWVCAGEPVDLAERLADLGCSSLPLRACFERVMTVADAEEIRAAALAPTWAPLLPPRMRRRYDTECAPLSRELRDRARSVLVGELALALLDEAIASSVEGNDPERAAERPIPLFEGEPLVRTIVGAHDEPFVFHSRDGQRHEGTTRVGAEAHFSAPAWVGVPGDVLALFPQEIEAAPRVPVATEQPTVLGP